MATKGESMSDATPRGGMKPPRTEPIGLTPAMVAAYGAEAALVLQVLTESDGPMTLGDIGRDTGLDLVPVLNALDALVRWHVVHTYDGSTWSLTPRGVER